MTSRAKLMAHVNESRTKNRDADIEAFKLASGYDLTEMADHIQGIGKTEDGHAIIKLQRTKRP